MIFKTLSGTMIFVFALAAVPVCEAQMINYKRRNQRQNATVVQKKSPGTAARNAQTDKINYYRGDFSPSAKTEQQSDNPRVTNRVERLYDLNRDGYLQPEEVNDFYKDVVSSVRNKGSFQVSSDLLRNFDANQDGRISRYEVGEISNQIN